MQFQRKSLNTHAPTENFHKVNFKFQLEFYFFNFKSLEVKSHLNYFQEPHIINYFNIYLFE